MKGATLKRAHQVAWKVMVSEAHATRAYDIDQEKWYKRFANLVKLARQDHRDTCDDVGLRKFTADLINLVFDELDKRRYPDQHKNHQNGDESVEFEVGEKGRHAVAYILCLYRFHRDGLPFGHAMIEFIQQFAEQHQLTEDEAIVFFRAIIADIILLVIPPLKDD